MPAVKRPRPASSALFFAALLVIYLASRLLLLGRQAAFIDEIIHVTYGRELLDGYFAAGAASGKWLSIQFMAPFLALPIEPVLAVRLASVFAGAGTLAAIYLIAGQLFSAWSGRLALLFYIFLPYTFFYNRLGLTDGILALVGSWILYFSIRIVRSPQGFNLLPLTGLLLAAPLVKLSGAIYFVIPLTAIMFLSPRENWIKNGFRISLPVLGSLLATAALFWIGAGTSLAGQKALGSPQSLIPLVAENLAAASEIYWLLLTPPLAILTAAALLWGLINRESPGARFLTAVFALVSLPYFLLAQTWYPRYLLMSLVAIALLLAEFSLEMSEKLADFRLSQRMVSVIPGLALAILLLWPALSDVVLIARPWSIPLPEIVRWQYINGWPAGYGAKELAAFLEAESRKAPDGINVLRPPHVVHTYRGGLDLYLAQLHAERVHLHVMLEGDVQDFKELAINLAAERRTFFVLDASHPESSQYRQLISQYLDLSHLWTFSKPDSDLGFEVWEIHGPL